MNKTNQIRTRIAPSPTGELHVGTARAALYNWLFAKQHQGQMILRFEDTDKARSKVEYEAVVLAGLGWLGLKWDEGPDIGGSRGPYRQSERLSSYQPAIERLLAENKAYLVDGGEAIKLRVTDEKVAFHDLVRGNIIIEPSTWGGDFVIARSLTDPVFHLAVVIDDEQMEISHVIRGEDHLTNTARHVLIQRALGIPSPIYAHLPLLLDEQRRKLSKRTGDTSLLSYKKEGFLAEAMVNYLALLGWNPGDEREYFSLEELVNEFDLDRVQRGGAIFSRPKLMAINKHYLRQMSGPELLHAAKKYAAEDLLDKNGFESEGEDYWQAALRTEQERGGTLKELVEKVEFFREEWPGEYARELLVWRKSTAEQTRLLLRALKAELKKIDEGAFKKEALEKYLLTWIDKAEYGRGDLLWPMRVALTGAEHSPGPFEVSAVLGKIKTMARIDAAIDKLKPDAS